MTNSNKNHYSKQRTAAPSMQEILAIIVSKTNQQPRHYGKGYIVRCPAHEDKNPSLSISEGNDRRTLLHCFSGCAVPDICDSLGIKVRDLFAKK